MKKISATIVFLLLLFPQLLSGQERYLNEIQVEDLEVIEKDGNVTIQMNINLNRLQIRSNDALLISPALRPTGRSQVERILPPIQVNGRKRDIVLRRLSTPGSSRYVQGEILNEVRRKNGTMQDVNYRYTFPKEDWMNRADLVLVTMVYSCADCFEYEDLKLVQSPLFNEVKSTYVPAGYKLTYIAPNVEEVKSRADKYSATFNFEVGRDELKREYKGNATELDKVNKVVSEVVKNKDLNITDFSIIGYASPEGNFDANQSLSARRAQAFANYLMSTYGIRRDQFSVTGQGEDWFGLKQVVRESSIPLKNSIIDIIDLTPNPDARDAKLRALDGGATYNNLLQNYYPALRRTEYVIAYNVRAFDIEEAKQIIKTNPKLLSLKEMYLVARSYPATSREFKEVFDIATRLYPNEPIAIINASAADIEGGNYQAAIERLSKLSSNADAVNNMGVAYAKMGMHERALECFQMATNMGNMNAQYNLAELNKQFGR